MKFDDEIVQRLIEVARELRSDDGLNFEYDRALTEFVVRFLGLDSDHDAVIRVAIHGI